MCPQAARPNKGSYESNWQNAGTSPNQPAYRVYIPGGYLMGMIALTSETVFSPIVLLWIVASLLAAMLLVAASSRRRAKLTESLRSHVDRHQQKTHAGDSDAAGKPDSKT